MLPINSSLSYKPCSHSCSSPMDRYSYNWLQGFFSASSIVLLYLLGSRQPAFQFYSRALFSGVSSIALTSFLSVVFCAYHLVLLGSRFVSAFSLAISRCIFCSMVTFLSTVFFASPVMFFFFVSSCLLLAHYFVCFSLDFSRHILRWLCFLLFSLFFFFIFLAPVTIANLGGFYQDL